MTYCLGIVTRHGLVMASDSRTNAGYDQINTCRKMFHFSKQGERAFVLLTSGSLSLTQSIVTLLKRDFDAGRGLASCGSMYEAARVAGDAVRRIAELDREAMARDQYQFNVHLLLGGQVGGEPPDLYLIYPQGNPLRATEDCPYLQIGECKYGRPILDRGVDFNRTTLDEAAKYAMISLDSTMRSNVTVGLPIDLLIYARDSLSLSRYRRFNAKDADLLALQASWEQALRTAARELPPISVDSPPPEGK